jgi:hypothetical protein
LPGGTRGKIFISCDICEYRYCVLISVIFIIDSYSTYLNKLADCLRLPGRQDITKEMLTDETIAKYSFGWDQRQIMHHMRRRVGLLGINSIKDAFKAVNMKLPAEH